MRYSILALLSVLLVFCAQPSFAGIFNDIPAGHPALETVEALAQRGIITGLDAKTFAGGRGVTRYELAIAIFRAMARIEESVSADSMAVSEKDLENIEYLKTEFSDELMLLGLRVELAQNRKELLREEISGLKNTIKSLKHKVKTSDEKIKMSGDWLARHTWKTHRDDHATNAFSGAAMRGNSNNSLTETQIRLRFIAKVDENINFMSRIRLFNRGSDNVTAAPSNRGGVFGGNGIGQTSQADLQVDCAFLEVKKVFHEDDWFLLGRGLLQTGHGLLLNADFDAVRYNRIHGKNTFMAQYIYDRHKGSYKDDAPVDFRGIVNLGFTRKITDGKYYANIFAQDNPDMVNRRIANTFVPGSAAGEQSGDRRRDLELGYSGGFGKEKRLTADLAVVLSNYNADIVKPAVGNILDVDLRGMSGHAALGWRANASFSAKLAYNFGDDEFAGAYSVSLDRRYSDTVETNLEDIARGNTWFRTGLINMSDLKMQCEYRPAQKHYVRIAADFLREMKDQARNDLSHHLAGNTDGRVPAGFVTANSPYDTFNNVRISDPAMRIITLEYRYQLAKNTRLRIGAVKCDFTGDAFKSVAGAASVSAGRGFNNEFDYQMVWTELYGKF